MKRLIFITSLFYLALAGLIAGCEKEGEDKDKEKTCNASETKFPSYELVDNEVVEHMQKAATDEYSFLWQRDFENVCPTKLADMSYYIHLTQESDTNIDVKFSATIITPSGTKYYFPTKTKQPYVVATGSYYLIRSEETDISLCAACDPLKTIKFSQRIEVKIKQSVGDPSNYIANHINKVVLNTKYHEPGKPE